MDFEGVGRSGVEQSDERAVVGLRHEGVVQHGVLGGAPGRGAGSVRQGYEPDLSIEKVRPSIIPSNIFTD